jgi:hypothetical protein
MEHRGRFLQQEPAVFQQVPYYVLEKENSRKFWLGVGSTLATSINLILVLIIGSFLQVIVDKSEWIQGLSSVGLFIACLVLFAVAVAAQNMYYSFRAQMRRPLHPHNDPHHIV